MQFELDETLIDSILFFMEDQSDDFFVDTEEAVVVSSREFDEDEAEDDERFISLPEWDSTDGFKLMEKFAVTLKNPPVQKALAKALDQGKGVFRAFKDVLSLHSEAEQLWYKFKEQEMRKRIKKWFNALREEWGIEMIGEEPEETDELILEDFRIRHSADADKTEAMKLHQYCCEEYRKAVLEVFCGEHSRENGSGWDFPNDISWVAENNDGGFAGYIFAQTEDGHVRIAALEVQPEYRGMGIGEALLNHCILHIDKTRISHILIDVPVNAKSFSKVLHRGAFTPYETRYCLELNPKEK